jgi:cytosine/creatinine deaminase
MIFDADHYWLTNVRIPDALMVRSKQGRHRQWAHHTEEFLRVDIEIVAGAIASIATAGTLSDYGAPSMDGGGGLVWPCFVDLHTHLDKGHIWERAPNPDGTFDQALATVRRDAAQNWHTEDVYRRMEFGLKCSYAHGTRAIRTHIDASGEQATISLGVFQTLQAAWRDRLILQAVCLVPLEYFLTPAGEALADQMAAIEGGILGGVAFMHPDLDAQLERVFALAKERHLALDFHADETADPASETLRAIAQATIRHRYQGRVVCGHCCSLANQPATTAAKTIALVKQAGIGIVSLPLCNLYLQDRHPHQTPHWRGVTQVHELKQAGVPVAIASDNCRDPFYGYGDHDALEVFTLSAKIAHLDRPIGDWNRAITTTPADLMGLPTVGRIGVGLPADLVLFKARSYSELLSRGQGDRIVLRAGKRIDRTLPDYAELDDLLVSTPAG